MGRTLLCFFVLASTSCGLVLERKSGLEINAAEYPSVFFAAEKDCPGFNGRTVFLSSPDPASPEIKQPHSVAKAAGDGRTLDTAAIQAAFDAAMDGDRLVLVFNRTYLIDKQLLIQDKRICLVGETGSSFKEKRIPVPGTKFFDTGIGRVITGADGKPIHPDLQTERAMLKLVRADRSRLKGVNGNGAVTANSPTWYDANYTDHDFDSYYPSFLWLLDTHDTELLSLSARGRMIGLLLSVSHRNRVEGFHIEGFLPGTVDGTAAGAPLLYNRNLDAQGKPLPYPAHEHARLAKGYSISGGMSNHLLRFSSANHGNIGTTGEGRVFLYREDGTPRLDVDGVHVSQSFSSMYNIVRECRGRDLWENGNYHAGYFEIIADCDIRRVYDNIGIKMRGIGNMILRNTVIDVANVGIGFTGFGAALSSGDNHNGRASVALSNFIDGVGRSAFYSEGYGDDNLPMRDLVFAYNTSRNSNRADSGLAFRLDVGRGHRIVGNQFELNPKAIGIGPKDIPSASNRPTRLLIQGNLFRYSEQTSRPAIDARWLYQSWVLGNRFINTNPAIHLTSADRSGFTGNRFSNTDNTLVAPDAYLPAAACSGTTDRICGTPLALAAPIAIEGDTSGFLVRVQDGRPATRPIHLVLMVRGGRVLIPQSPGVTFLIGEQGVPSDLWVIHGSVQAVNAALSSLEFEVTLGAKQAPRVEATVLDRVNLKSNQASPARQALAGGYPSETAYALLTVADR